jgi:hypothetical protein
MAAAGKRDGVVAGVVSQPLKRSLEDTGSMRSSLPRAVNRAEATRHRRNSQRLPS